MLKKYKTILSFIILTLLISFIAFIPYIFNANAEELNSYRNKGLLTQIINDNLILTKDNYTKYKSLYPIVENLLLNIKDPKTGILIFNNSQLIRGKFDSNMENAIRNFQYKYFISNEEKYLPGEIDGVTLKKIISFALISNSKYAVENFGKNTTIKDLEKGLSIITPLDKNYPKDLIVRLQNKLKLTFLKNGTPLITNDTLKTGTYEINTVKAVATFQKEYLNIEDNNWKSGLIDYITYKKLNSVLDDQKQAKNKSSENLASEIKSDIKVQVNENVKNINSINSAPSDITALPYSDIPNNNINNISKRNAFSGETYKKSSKDASQTAQKGYELIISQGQSKSLSYPYTITNVAIGSPDIADVIVISSREILINGIKPGSTTLSVWSGGIRKSYIINVSKAQVGKIFHVFKLRNLKLQRTKVDQNLSTITIEDDKFVIDPLDKMLKTILDCDSFSIFTSLGVVTALGTPSEIARVEQLIKKVDTPIDQIVLETRVIESSNQAIKQLGIDWAAQGGNYSGSFTGTDTGGGILTFTQDANLSRAFAARLTALENQGKIKTLACPKVLALSGQHSDIYVGTTIPIVSTSTQGSQAVEMLDTGIKLIMTPRTNFDGSITLWLATFVSDLTSTLYQGYPSIATKYAQANINVKDGETIVIGGLKFNDSQLTASKIPILGDIPVLGYLFKKDKKTQKEREVIITITPHILSKLPFK